MDEDPSPEKDYPKALASVDMYSSAQIDNPKPVSLMYKRRRHNNLNSGNVNASEDSTRTSQDPSSSTITTAATTLPAMTATTTTSAPARKHFLSALVEYSLLESFEPKESTVLHPPDLDASKLDSSVPPNCVKLIEDLQIEIRKLNAERETMRFEMMSAQAMIKILQSRVDALKKENEDMKSGTQDP